SIQGMRRTVRRYDDYYKFDDDDDNADNRTIWSARNVRDKIVELIPGTTSKTPPVLIG
ncbi:hypothetical protein DPMN_090507, partial [Dreissena polymorpha]